MWSSTDAHVTLPPPVLSQKRDVPLADILATPTVSLSLPPQGLLSLLRRLKKSKGEVSSTITATNNLVGEQHTGTR